MTRTGEDQRVGKRARPRPRVPDRAPGRERIAPLQCRRLFDPARTMAVSAAIETADRAVAGQAKSDERDVLLARAAKQWAPPASQFGQGNGEHPGIIPRDWCGESRPLQPLRARAAAPGSNAAVGQNPAPTRP